MQINYVKIISDFFNAKSLTKKKKFCLSFLIYFSYWKVFVLPLRKKSFFYHDFLIFSLTRFSFLASKILNSKNEKQKNKTSYLKKKNQKIRNDYLLTNKLRDFTYQKMQFYSNNHRQNVYVSMKFFLQSLAIIDTSKNCFNKNKIIKSYQKKNYFKKNPLNSKKFVRTIIFNNININQDYNLKKNIFLNHNFVYGIKNILYFLLNKNTKIKSIQNKIFLIYFSFLKPLLYEIFLNKKKKTKMVIGSPIFQNLHGVFNVFKKKKLVGIFASKQIFCLWSRSCPLKTKIQDRSNTKNSLISSIFICNSSLRNTTTKETLQAPSNLNQILTEKKFFSRNFDKSRLKKFVIWFSNKWGLLKTFQLLETLKFLGFKYAQSSGLSLNLEDLYIPDEKESLVNFNDFSLLEEEFKVFQKINEETNYSIKFISTWTFINQLLRNAFLNYFKTGINPLNRSLQTSFKNLNFSKDHNKEWLNDNNNNKKFSKNSFFYSSDNDFNQQKKKLQEQKTGKKLVISPNIKNIIKPLANHKISKSTGDYSVLEKGSKTKNYTGSDSLYIMAFSGARGNMSQVSQLTLMRGLMSDPLGNLVEFPIVSNFKEGLNLTEYLISCYGARKGIIDTGLRTATAGDFTRRLVDVAHSIIIRHYDCLTKNGIYLNDLVLFQNQKTLLSLEQRLIGRIIANNSRISQNYRNKEIPSSSPFMNFSWLSSMSPKNNSEETKLNEELNLKNQVSRESNHKKKPFLRNLEFNGLKKKKTLKDFFISYPFFSSFYQLVEIKNQQKNFLYAETIKMFFLDSFLNFPQTLFWFDKLKVSKKKKNWLRFLKKINQNFFWRLFIEYYSKISCKVLKIPNYHVKLNNRNYNIKQINNNNNKKDFPHLNNFYFQNASNKPQKQHPIEKLPSKFSKISNLFLNHKKKKYYNLSSHLDYKKPILNYYQKVCLNKRWLTPYHFNIFLKTSSALLPSEQFVHKSKPKPFIFSKTEEKLLNDHLLSFKIHEEILVRSPLTCETKFTPYLCRKCYGWNAMGKTVDLGDAVGVIAAQSLGEPGTQLTLRTFHTGGIYSESVGEFQLLVPFDGNIIIPNYCSIKRYFNIKEKISTFLAWNRKSIHEYRFQHNLIDKRPMQSLYKSHDSEKNQSYLTFLNLFSTWTPNMHSFFPKTLTNQNKYFLKNEKEKKISENLVFKSTNLDNEENFFEKFPMTVNYKAAAVKKKNKNLETYDYLLYRPTFEIIPIYNRYTSDFWGIQPAFFSNEINKTNHFTSLFKKKNEIEYLRKSIIESMFKNFFPQKFLMKLIQGHLFSPISFFHLFSPYVTSSKNMNLEITNFQKNPKISQTEQKFDSSIIKNNNIDEENQELFSNIFISNLQKVIYHSFQETKTNETFFLPYQKKTTSLNKKFSKVNKAAALNKNPNFSSFNQMPYFINIFKVFNEVELESSNTLEPGKNNSLYDAWEIPLISNQTKSNLIFHHFSLNDSMNFNNSQKKNTIFFSDIEGKIYNLNKKEILTFNPIENNIISLTFLESILIFSHYFISYFYDLSSQLYITNLKILNFKTSKDFKRILKLKNFNQNKVSNSMVFYNFCNIEEKINQNHKKISILKEIKKFSYYQNFLINNSLKKAIYREKSEKEIYRSTSRNPISIGRKRPIQSFFLPSRTMQNSTNFKNWFGWYSNKKKNSIPRSKKKVDSIYPEKFAYQNQRTNQAILLLKAEGGLKKNTMIVEIKQKTNGLLKTKKNYFFFTVPLKKDKGIFNQEIPSVLPPASVTSSFLNYKLMTFSSPISIKLFRNQSLDFFFDKFICANPTKKFHKVMTNNQKEKIQKKFKTNLILSKYYDGVKILFFKRSNFKSKIILKRFIKTPEKTQFLKFYKPFFEKNKLFRKNYPNQNSSLWLFFSFMAIAKKNHTAATLNIFCLFKFFFKEFSKTDLSFSFVYSYFRKWLIPKKNKFTFLEIFRNEKLLKVPLDSKIKKIAKKTKGLSRNQNSMKTNFQRIIGKKKKLSKSQLFPINHNLKVFNFSSYPQNKILWYSLISAGSKQFNHTFFSPFVNSYFLESTKQNDQPLSIDFPEKPEIKPNVKKKKINKTVQNQPFFTEKIKKVVKSSVVLPKTDNPIKMNASNLTIFSIFSIWNKFTVHKKMKPSFYYSIFDPVIVMHFGELTCQSFHWMPFFNTNGIFRKSIENQKLNFSKLTDQKKNIFNLGFYFSLSSLNLTKNQQVSFFWSKIFTHKTLSIHKKQGNQILKKKDKAATKPLLYDKKKKHTDFILIKKKHRCGLKKNFSFKKTKKFIKVQGSNQNIRIYNNLINIMNFYNITNRQGLVIPFHLIVKNFFISFYDQNNPMLKIESSCIFSRPVKKQMKLQKKKFSHEFFNQFFLFRQSLLLTFRAKFLSKEANEIHHSKKLKNSLNLIHLYFQKKRIIPSKNEVFNNFSIEKKSIRWQSWVKLCGTFLILIY